MCNISKLNNYWFWLHLITKVHRCMDLVEGWGPGEGTPILGHGRGSAVMTPVFVIFNPIEFLSILYLFSP